MSVFYADKVGFLHHLSAIALQLQLFYMRASNFYVGCVNDLGIVGNTLTGELLSAAGW